MSKPNEIQLAFNFDADSEKNNMPVWIVTQRNCLIGTRFERPMQRFVDWWWHQRSITDDCYVYVLPSDARTWGMFECFFRSLHLCNGQKLVTLDDKIPQRIADALNLSVWEAEV